MGNADKAVVKSSSKGFRYKFRSEGYLYEESLAPNHVHLWLALSLPSVALDRSSRPLKLNIPDTLVYGFGKNPVWLYTDDNGFVNKKLGDSCSEENIFKSFSGTGVVAIDKEPAYVPCMSPLADFDAPPTVRYEGTYICPLTAPSLRRLLLKPRQHPPRVYSIQRTVPNKYGDHSAVVRVLYSKHGKCYAWSMIRIQPFIVKPASPSKQNRQTASDSDDRAASASPIVGLPVPDNAVTPSSPLRQLRRMDTVIVESPQGTKPHPKLGLNLSTVDNFQIPTPSKRHSMMEQNIEDITNLYDDNIAFCDEDPKRLLEFLSDANCIVDEVMPAAAEAIYEIAAGISKHISSIFHRTMEELTVDVAKDENDVYRLADIVAFRFEDWKTAPVKLVTRVRRRIELEFNCILDPHQLHLDPAEVHAENIVSAAKHERSNKFSNVDWAAQAVGATPCSMCESKLPPHELCYAITSTLIQSTIVHMRSRLPQKYWPNFCRDTCYAMRSMARVEGDPFNIKGLTVADIRICGLCYEICNKEMTLIEIEQKLSKFTRTINNSVGNAAGKSTTLTSFSCKDSTPAEAETTTQQTLKKATSDETAWNPTENFRMRNRPSVMVKLAEAQQKSKVLNKSPSAPALNLKRGTALKEDLMMMKTEPASSVNRRPLSAGAKPKTPARTPVDMNLSSPVDTSPIRRGDNHSPTNEGSLGRPRSAAATPGKSLSFNKSASAKQNQVEQHIPAQGRSIIRSTLNENMTMCRALVGIQQIKDLPVIIFEHFENFRVHYNILGRDVNFPAVKKSKYYRKDAYRYKTFSVDGENDSVSLSSGDNEKDGGSDFDANDTGDPFRVVTCPLRGSGVLSRVFEEDGTERVTSSDDESDENVSIVVGTLAVQKMRVAYSLIPGNSAAGSPSPELERYFAKNRKILIVLCGDVKYGVNIYDESRWLAPPPGFSCAEKSKQLQHSLTSIRVDAVNKTLFQGRYSRSNSLRQKHLSRLFRKSYKDAELPATVELRKTESGEVLPEGAIAYGYVNYYQFLNATVNRIDIVTPMTYALTHVPRERSVPMLKAVIGFERLYSPVDPLSLPYSIVNVGHGKGYDAFVPELEDQLTSSEPLPAEWLVSGVQDDTSSSRRKAVATFLQTSFQESASGMLSASKLEMESEVLVNTQANEFAINLVDGKRTAPVKFHHESRNEQTALTRKIEQSVKNFKDEEEYKERSPHSLWCFSAHIVSGHHMGPSIPENMRQNSKMLNWCYKFKFLGDTISGNCTTRNDFAFDEIFRFESLSKHFFLGEIAAIEDMFANMDPLDFELKLVDKAVGAEQQRGIVFRQNAHGVRESVLLSIPDEDAFAQKFTGSFSLNEFKGQRFFESTILLHPHIDVGGMENVYPAYAFAEFHFFRMGGGQSLSIPKHLALGKEIVPGVRKVVKMNKLVRASSFIEEEHK